MNKTFLMKGAVILFANEIADALQDINYDLKDIQEKLGLTFGTIADVKNFNEQSLGKYLDASKAELMGNAKKVFIPTTIRKQFDTQFDNSYNDVLPAVIDLQKRMKQLAQMKVKPLLVKGEVIADKDNVHEAAVAQSTVEFNDTQLRYADALQAYADALKALGDFEKKNGVKHIPSLEQRLTAYGYKVTEEAFYQMTEA